MPEDKEAKHPGGRPTKCTPEVIEDFAKYMGAGLYLEEACDLVGITSATGRNWRNWGEEALNAAGNDLEAVPEEKRPYAEFFAMVHAEAAKALARNTALIQQAAQKAVDGDWRAAAWFLEHRRPDTWGKREQKTTLAGDPENPLQHEHRFADLGPGDLARLLLESVEREQEQGNDSADD